MRNSIIQEIIDILSKERSLSSPDLTKALNASSSTITKYTSYLIDKGILKATYSNAKKGDVKSTRYNLHPAKYFMIYDFSNEAYKIYVCALTGRIKKEYSYKPYKNKDFYENKHKFLKIVENITHAYGKSKNCGTAVILSDTYDNNPILKARMMTMINDLPHSIPFLINKKKYFIAELLKSSLSATDFSLCLYLNQYNFASAYISTTTDVSNLTFSDIGKNYMIKNIPLSDYISYMEDPEDVVDAFYNVIKGILLTVPINKVAICGNLFPHLNALCELLRERFSDFDLEFLYYDHSNYVTFLSNELKNAITKDLIATYLNK